MRRLAALARLVVVISVVGACQSLGVLSPDADPYDVLDAYLRAFQAGNCQAARVMTTETFRPGNGELCGATRLLGYEIDPRTAGDPTTDSAVGLSATLTTTGTADGSVEDGETLWFYGLARQPGGPWRIVGGGSGP